MENHKITIKNLGPIKEINDFEIKKINFLTGKSGTGKSLICKAIYCFNNINFLGISPTKQIFIFNLQERLQKNFSDYSNYEIKYYYNQQDFIEIKKDEKILLSNSFEKKLYKFIENSKIKLENEDNINIDQIFRSIKEFDKELKIKSTVFFPATRSFVLDFDNLLNLIFRAGNISIKGNDFSYELNEFINSWKIYKKSFKSIHPEFKEILRGEVEIDLDLIRFKPDGSKNYISESSLSSGQKEVLSIAVILSKLLEEKQESLLIIEEPESNLFPEDQLKLLEFLVFFANETNSKLLITSHSPYFCGLADAILVKNKKDKQLINPKEFSANYLDDGKLISIFDEEDDEINIDYIDSASDIISDKYRKNKDNE
ncbi:ATP-binding protein [Rickettsiales bacterium]|nr:ATP-binding protein [Rickettsiales bacterium]